MLRQRVFKKIDVLVDQLLLVGMEESLLRQWLLASRFWHTSEMKT